MSKVEISRELLEDIRHELMTLTGLKAFDSKAERVKNIKSDEIIKDDFIAIPVEDLIDLDFEEICTRIDEEDIND